MGTNYYARFNECECCGRYDELHIGKSSVGWCFGLHVCPEEGIHSLESWREILRDASIYDEYDQEIDFETMMDCIENRSCEFDRIPPTGYSSWESFLVTNRIVEGPNGLFRHKIDGRFCIGHGEGTWDLCIGEFS